MPLIYSFVARDTTVLAEYTPYTGNFNTVAIECLQKLQNPESKFTIACDRHTFNYLLHNGFTYLVVADEAYGRQVPFAFLDRVKQEFEEEYAEKGRVSTAHSLDRTFGPRLKSHMEYCMAHPDEISKITQVQRKVNEVKDVMVENIEKVLERGERIELLVDKTDVLRNQAEVFQKKGRSLRNKMWWNYCKWKLLVIGCLIILAIVIFLIACFSGGRDCTQQNVREKVDINTPGGSGGGGGGGGGGESGGGGGA
ncbi:R-SNARE protein, VAMP72-family [Dunaliella salina]|uniref:R-SNARE protein, VAMP72-family n=1 Tax=Dunaliella salina TaxID=3046 RepID=A0ABQ7GW55_DUNSA|nr:R-SNARE protein, VAMP72-family [Dunaliella salina]|eukprot:KAF5838848.1 R-SNARE protein, VAMP72-family [Dunaliella salina]